MTDTLLRSYEWVQIREICPHCGGLVEELRGLKLAWAERCPRCKWERSFWLGRSQDALFGSTERVLRESGVFDRPQKPGPIQENASRSPRNGVAA